MSVIPNEPISITSAAGQNSDSIISGGNWVGNTYTGQWELNDYAYSGVNLQVDEAGTLFFDFSQDGVNFSSYPVAGFTVVSGINEVHTAWKGGRYFRVRFVGSGGRSYFRLKTFYTNSALPLSAPLNQSIGSDQDATVTRAVLTGETPSGSFINQKTSGSSFTTTAALSDGDTYDSGVLNLNGYQQVQTDIVCSNNGTIKFIFGSSPSMTGSTPGSNGVERVVTVPYISADGFQMYSAPAFTPYVRYTFENTAGQGATTQLFFDTKFLTASLSGQVLGTNAFISPAMVANLGRNILVGQNKAGRFGNMPVDSENHLFVNLHDPLTAFGQVKTAEETIEIQAQFPYEIITPVVTTVTANGGTVTSSNSQAVLATSTASTGSAKMTTKSVMKYQPGTGCIIRFTGVFTAGVAGADQIIGWGDDNDGFFVGFNGTDFGVLRRQGGVDNWTTISNFNVDQLDGSKGALNPSGMNIDFTTGNVFEIKLQWLGYGAITFRIEDPESGDFEPFHIIKYANSETIPSIFAPSLPIQAEVVKTSGATNVTLSTASMMGAIEGRRIIKGPTFSHKKVGSTSTPHVFSIRNKATNVYGGTNTNRYSVYLKIFSYANDGTSTTTYTIEQGADITGGTWTSVDANNSLVEYNNTGTINTAGTELLPFTAAKGTGDVQDIFEQLIELRPGQIITIRSSNGNSSDVAISWVEDI